MTSRGAWGARLSMADSAPGRFQKPIRALANWSWAERLAEQRSRFRRPVSQTTAMEMIDYFYRQSLHSEDYHYFSCRFGQPRHLAALALATLLPRSHMPLLDLACGFGHFMHYWRASPPAQQVVGVDRNFFQLYVARSWVAPRGDFVCADADQRLPFAAKSFGGVLCSDAFHYFLRRAQCAGEMRRVA
jgi:ubiquinone/menaquinone biosynthesis C-methylase UbiE